MTFWVTQLGTPGLEMNAVAFFESANQVGPGLLAVSSRNLVHHLGLGAVEGAHLLKEVLEAGWADELEDNHRVIRGIP